MRTRGQGKFAILSTGMLIACMTVALVSPSLAGAEPSRLYTDFTKCPTMAPEMNDPANQSAACFSNVATTSKMKVGDFELQLDQPVSIQFAVAGMDGEDGLVKTVPGSTSLDVDPVEIPNPLATQGVTPTDKGSSPAQAQPPAGQPAQTTPSVRKAKEHRKKHRRHRHKRKHRSAHRGGKSRHRLASFNGARASAAAGPQIKVTVEQAGDIHEVNLLVTGSELLENGIAFKLPVRLHLEGEGLGSNCYIGTPAVPIVLAPEKVAPESSFFFGHDNNGFKVGLIGSGGTKLEDRTLSIPGATGCGLGGLANGEVNELVGLPAASGSARMILIDNTFKFAEADYDGVAPEGGAELQAAFDAAR